MVCIIFCLNFCRLFFLDHNIIIFGIFCVMNDEMDGRVEMTKTVRHRCILRLLMFRYHVEYNTSPKMSKSRNNFINTSTNVSCDVMVMMLRRRLFFFNKKNTVSTKTPLCIVSVVTYSVAYYIYYILLELNVAANKDMYLRYPTQPYLTMSILHITFYQTFRSISVASTTTN